MDIVITTNPPPFAQERLRYALRSLKHVEHNKVFIVGYHDMKCPNTTKMSVDGLDIEKIFAVASRTDLSEDFIWMPDNCVLMGGFEPNQRYVSTSALYRASDAVDVMVSTIKYLLTHSLETLDFELPIPMVLNKALVMELMVEVGKNRELNLRSVYFNRFPLPHLRIGSPVMQKWSHYDDPKGVILALEPPCYEHAQCLRWLKRKHPDRSEYESVG